jgi:hypothetical protein
MRADDRPPAEARPARAPARERPGFHVSIIPASRWPERIGYGSISPSAPCGSACCGAGFGYGFGWGRFVPHSHFFPSLAGSRRAPLFFPYGHQLDADAFLVGRGYWID